MEYTTLGDTGLRVSRICIGGLSFGTQREWMLDEGGTHAILERAADLGINFVDTANGYSMGDSERFVGSFLADRDRDEFVVATKLFYGMRDDPNAEGLSRKSVERELAASLDRLHTDYVDLYQIHKWDYETPIEETLRALTDAVRRGDVRYLGASKTWAYQLAQAHHASERLGLERFVTMQNFYNLVYREEEREMLPYCRESGVGVLPFSPLMRGYLARPDDDLETTTRGDMEAGGRHRRWSPDSEANAEIKSRALELAGEKGVSLPQISLAWLLHQEPVVAPVVGVTRIEHVEEAVSAVEIDLSASEQAYLEEPYRSVSVIGHE